ncbi:leucine-rich repeat and IQ domain-containing protein 4 [Chionomys nivalis]|uniref:leucine-rich repeat and IQ domain-containing protein 4 n=1 Tax=Chionomys nivalis TaxID=269649 RepID=UPI002597C47F|nr:leucine-rich repeat and IQ domain-containing protein 4 [Chionomys nivalis]
MAVKGTPEFCLFGIMELSLKVLSKEVLKPEQLPKVLQRNDSQRVTDRTYFIDGSNQGLKTIPSEILALKEIEELHLENNQISEIPQDIQNLKNVKVLYLHKNKLQGLSPELGFLSSLESLDLSGNPLLYSSLRVLSCLRTLRELRLYQTGLREVPSVICKSLHHLELLGLSGNNLKSLPKEIVNQSKLKEIYLKHNQFSAFPSDLCALFNLEVIDLDHNKLKAIPDEIGNLVGLQQFYVASNNLPLLPESLSRCTKLLVLDLTQNLLHSLPPSLQLLTELKEVGLSGNLLEKVPRLLCRWSALNLLYLRNTGLRGLRRSFKRLVNLLFLDLSQNHIDHFPAQICALRNLEILALDDNKVTQLPSTMSSLSKLKILGLTGNDFSSFPEEIFSLVSLEKLYIGQDQGSKFTYLPENIKKLQKLKELYIENNQLEQLPASLGLMPNLEVLDCRHNLLKQLPDAICHAQGLRELLLEDNLLTRLPEDLDHLVNLKVLTLMNNPMEDPPMAVCAQGKDAIWNCLKENRLRKIMAMKVQAWWRGTMVRKGYGTFEELQRARRKGKNSPKDKKGKKAAAKGARRGSLGQEAPQGTPCDPAVPCPPRNGLTPAPGPPRAGAREPAGCLGRPGRAESRGSVQPAVTGPTPRPPPPPRASSEPAPAESLPQPGARGGLRNGPRTAALSRDLRRLPVQAPNQKELGGAADMAERRRLKKRIQVARQEPWVGGLGAPGGGGSGEDVRAGGRRQDVSGAGCRDGPVAGRCCRPLVRGVCGAAGKEGREEERRSEPRARPRVPAAAAGLALRGETGLLRSAHAGLRASRPFPFFLALPKLRPRWLGWEAAEGGTEGRAAALCSRSPAPGPACELPVQMLGGGGPPLPLWSSFNRTAYWTLAGFLPGDAM